MITRFDFSAPMLSQVVQVCDSIFTNIKSSAEMGFAAAWSHRSDVLLWCSECNEIMLDCRGRPPGWFQWEREERRSAFPSQRRIKWWVISWRRWRGSYISMWDARCFTALGMPPTCCACVSVYVCVSGCICELEEVWICIQVNVHSVMVKFKWCACEAHI